MFIRSGSRRHMPSPFCLQPRAAFWCLCWSSVFFPQGTRWWHKSQCQKQVPLSVAPPCVWGGEMPSEWTGLGALWGSGC